MKVKVELCMGSSCFARGNNRILSCLEESMEKEGWEGKVEITSHLCLGNCSGGPVIRINGENFLNLSGGELISIIGKTLHEQ